MLKENLEIKDYTLKKFLGRGGFGEVWLADKKIEIADKRVPFALKFISGDRSGIGDYTSVRREINTWIDASGNKNVVSVLDGFIHEDLFVIVSEYANNGSLRDWLRRNGGKSPSIEMTVEIMSGILDGLSHLHAQNIVHRDLKPENVLLKGDVPCIADFGVSRMIETTSLSSSQIGTHSAGSPLYMSPESFERTKPVPQVDIWSAGVILFEMLSGKTPYSAETIPALIFEIVTKEPRTLSDDIPESFREVVKKALNKDVFVRFETARDMRDALMRALYSNDFTETVGKDEIASTKRKQNPILDKEEYIKTLAATHGCQIISNAENKSSNKKSLIFAAAGAFLLVVIAVLSFMQFSKSNNSEAVITNQTVNTNGAVNNNKTISPSAPAAATLPPANSDTGEITNVGKDIEKRKAQPTVQTAPVRAEAAKKSEPAKANTNNNPKAKKKVTLDDLINGNK